MSDKKISKKKARKLKAISASKKEHLEAEKAHLSFSWAG